MTVEGADRGVTTDDSGSQHIAEPSGAFLDRPDPLRPVISRLVLLPNFPPHGRSRQNRGRRPALLRCLPPEAQRGREKHKNGWLPARDSLMTN